MIVVVGLSHKTAPIEVREQAALNGESLTEVLGQLVCADEVGEAMIVSTCNRVEIIASGKAHESTGDVAHAVERVLAARVPGIAGHLYRREGEAAVLHLFRVAASLDSLVLGEPQILGQVKEAFDFAQAAGTIGGRLRRVMGHAVRAAKRVRSETTVGAGQVSVPSVAVELARQIFGDLRGHRAALVGSGAMGESAAKLLAGAGAELVVVGRNQERVKELVLELGGQPRSLDELGETLAEVDVVVSTTSAPGYVITRDMVAAARRRRKGRNLFFIDLAVPRDIDPEIGDLDSVFLYNVDDLSQIVAETLSSRQREAAVAEELILSETRAYERALSAEQATPTIVALRSQFAGVFKVELERSLRGKLKHLSADDREALERMLEAGMNKLLHPALRHLRSLAVDDEAQAELDQQVALLRSLFDLAPDAGIADTASPAARRGAVTGGSTEPEAGAPPSQQKVS